MNIFTIDSLIKQAEKAHKEKDYVKEKNAYQELYDLYKCELGELKDVDKYYRYLRTYNEALELYEEDYAAYKDILRELRENHFPTLSAVNDLVNLYSDYNRTIQLLNTLYDACKVILGENHPATLSVLKDLANYYSELGDYNKALEIRNAVYNTRKEILGEDDPDTLRALGDLANSCSKLGDYNKAFELQNTVYNTLKETLGENHPDTLSSLSNLGNSYFNLGDYNSALEIRNSVYNARKENLDEDDPDTLKALANLASSYSCLGDYNKAFELQNTVYNIQKNILGENDLDTLLSLNNLASCYSYLGDYNKALEVENEAYNALKEDLGESHPNTLLALSNLLVLQVRQDETDNESIKNQENHLTAYFENTNNLKATAFSIKEVSSRRNFLESFNDLYKLLKSCVFKRKIYGLLDYLFINKNLSFEIDVSKFHNETMDDRLSLEEVSHMISNQLIIDFYELDNSKYGLILIKQGKYSCYMVNYPDIINGSFIDAEDIKSFIGSLEDYGHIYICPDGKLYNLSFERILNCLNISYLSSVQTLFKNNTDEDNTNQLVSFVYPDFSGTQSEDNDRGDTKGVLYGSYLEGMFIHDIYGEMSTIYSSGKANHDNFLNTRRPKILHVSTHGDYLDNEHMEPMDRGILCLSGYNVEDNNSGYISAKEIQYMDLKGTELVVLSACNTGLGENISGEGIYGIRRAFELAGCQTLLLTVEEVDDFNSAIFMKSFYERYNQTNNVYQSFKDTKEYLKKYGLVELNELRDVFEKEMKNKIKNPFVYTRNLNELNNRIEESETIGQIVRKKNNQYIQEDWNGFIIQGKIENA